MLALGMLLSLNAQAQKKIEFGAFADLVNLNQYKKSNGGADVADFKIANPPLSIGGYVALYPYKFLGFYVGLQYIKAENGSVTYNQLTSPQIGDRTYTYHYKALRLPIGITGDIGSWVYYAGGVNLHWDQSEVVDGPMDKEKINGVGMHGELGLYRSLFTNTVKIRLGFTAQSENNFALSNENFNIMDWGLRVRLGIRI